MSVFGTIEQITGSMKNSVLSLILFFILGLIWLIRAQRKLNPGVQPQL
jgi:UMF1 family MFS transporter